jgi:2-oxoglutarate dehydrogenase E2 component (dihydrolipoamide succinyltransferase)
MAVTEIKVPALGESVSEATVSRWLKQAGDAVQQDEPLVELETDKITLEVNAPGSGVLTTIHQKEGSTVTVGDLLGALDSAAKAGTKAVAPPVPAPAAPKNEAKDEPKLSPAVRKAVAEAGINPQTIPGTGKDGRLTKADVLTLPERPATLSAASSALALEIPAFEQDTVQEERVRMTRLRKTIATRLKEAQNTAAMLTTFNEVDMTNLMAARTTYKDLFEKKYGIKLGFMSFFVKAAVQALKEIPSVNSEIDGDDIIYKNYYHVGVAVSTPQGLVVPVVRNVDRLSFVEIEKTIATLGQKGREGTLSMQDLSGGTFTITNGGVFGSLLSTPILNPPQTGILGMHKVQERPMVVKGQIVARPMMYLALTYDHRLIDGREAVTFLVRIKECVENPERLLLGV